jgi:competence protein ComEC
VGSSRRSGLRLTFLVAAAVAFFPLFFRANAAPLSDTGLFRVTFIDVGQGDSIWLSTPDGWDILVDGGREGQGPALVSYLQSQGVTDIEVLILTHPHADHVGGLVAVLESLEVDQALTNCYPYPTEIHQTFQELLLSKAIPTSCVRDGDTFAWGAYVSAVAWHPPEPLMSGTASDVNNNSIALLVSYGAIDFLFTGDIQAEAEASILASEPDLDAEILKVPHHGSNTSSTTPFLTAVGPDLAVISVGAGNRFGLPSAEALQRLRNAGVTLYRTDFHGTILVETDGGTYWVDPQRQPSAYLPVGLYVSPVQ